MIICNLQKLLKQKKWTRYKLRQKTKISYPTLQSLFHGRSKGYSADVLNRLCAALRCQPGDLLKWKPDRFPRSKSNR